jgi:YVTN family beta-propeller protein
MKQYLAFNKTRTSLILMALITSLSACNQQKVEETAEAVQPETTEVVANAAGFAYVTSQDSGVSVIDLNTMEVIKTIDVKAEGPRGLGVTDDGKKINCCNP